MDSDKAFRPSDLKMILRTVYRRKWLMIIPWIIVSGLAIAGSYLIPPEFQSSTIISIDSRIDLTPELSRSLGNAVQNNWNVDFAERLRSYYNEITSANYINQLDKQLGLSQKPEFQQVIAEAASRMPDMTIDEMVVHLLQSSLKSRIDVGFAGEDQLRISISAPSAVEARDLTQTLGNIFIEQMHLQKMNLSRIRGDFSDTQLDKFELKLQEAIDAKTKFESYLSENRMSEEVIATANQTDIASEIYNIKQEITRYQQREDQILNQIEGNEDRRVATPRLEESTMLKNLEDGWREELTRISDLVLAHPWNSSAIQSLKVRLNGFITDIEDENARLINKQFSDQSPETRNLLTLFFNSRADLTFYRARESAMKAAQEDLTARINRIPEDRARLAQLEQDIVSATGSRDRWKQEQESSAISQDLYRDTRYRVVEPAKIPLSPFKPDRLQIALIGLVLGLVIGGVAVVLMELMDKSFKKVEEVSDELGLPVLGIAPKMPFLKKVAR